MDLASRKCVPCEGGVDKFDAAKIATFLQGLDGWVVTEDQLHKRYVFKNFVEAMSFLNKVAEIAEGEGHHPDFCVHYNKVDFTIWTHAIGGLSENDFILAAKIDLLAA